jgi:hypothetical protein
MAGCYRLYEGALLTVKPMLKHRPELQRAIDEGFVNAERDPLVWRRAFTLRAVLDRIRREARAKVEEKKEAEKKEPDEKKGKDDKKGPEKKEPEGAQVTGKVTYKGAELTEGTVVFHPEEGKPFSASVRVDGRYRVKGLEPGKYRVTFVQPKVPSDPDVKPVPVPARFANPETSGLTFAVREGLNRFDLELVGKEPEKKEPEKKEPEKKEPDEKKGKDDKKDPEKEPDEKKGKDKAKKAPDEDEKPAPKKEPEEARVEGKVTFKGAPLTFGTVGFYPEKGKPVLVPLFPDGAYVAKGLAPGEYRLTVAVVLPKVPDEPPPGKEDEPPPKKPAAKVVAIPLRFANPNTSELTLTVRRGRNVHDIALKD